MNLQNQQTNKMKEGQVEGEKKNNNKEIHVKGKAPFINQTRIFFSVALIRRSFEKQDRPLDHPVDEHGSGLTYLFSPHSIQPPTFSGRRSGI